LPSVFLLPFTAPSALQPPQSLNPCPTEPSNFSHTPLFDSLFQSCLQLPARFDQRIRMLIKRNLYFGFVSFFFSSVTTVPMLYTPFQPVSSTHASSSPPRHLLSIASMPGGFGRPLFPVRLAAYFTFRLISSSYRRFSDPLILSPPPVCAKHARKYPAPLPPSLNVSCSSNPSTLSSIQFHAMILLRG